MADRSSYSPSPDFVNRAHVSGPDAYAQLRQRAAADPEAFWGELAEKELHWFEKWSRTLDWKAPAAGEHTLVSRAIDVRANVQPAEDDPAIKLKKTYWEDNAQFTRTIAVS